MTIRTAVKYLIVALVAMAARLLWPDWTIGIGGVSLAVLLVPNIGEDLALKAFLNHTAGQNGVLRLYTNNITPAETDTAGTYTEASGNGYSALTLTGSSWTITQGAPTEAAYAEQTFTFTGALGNVYGYFVTQTTSGSLMYAERFTGAPFNIQNNGDQIKITPKITAD